MARDFYEVLGVARDADEDAIKRAYRRLARKHHPDVDRSPDAAKRFGEIGEAYETLSDPEKRKLYDRYGHAGPGAASAGGPGRRSASAGWSAAGAHGGAGPDIGSIFEEMFGGGGPFRAAPGGAGFGSAPPAPQRGRDVEHRITVTFMTAARGGTEHVKLAIDGRTRAVDVRIPAGVEEGAKLRLRGRGGASPGGGPAGDLLLEIEIGKHPWFRREDLDIVLEVPITIAEAARGVEVEVPLLTGRATVKIPPGTSSGSRLRIPGRGIEKSGGKRGDFLASVRIVAPATLSEAGLQALDVVAAELKNPREKGPWADSGQGGSET